MTSVLSSAPSALERREDPADLRVGVGQEAGEDLLLAGEHPPLVGGQVGPGLHPLGPLGEHGARRAPCPIARWRANTSARQASHPLSNTPRYGSTHSGATWCGACMAPEREVQEEGLARCPLLLVLHHADGLVGQVLAQVVALLGPARRLDVVVVADQVRGPVVGVALQEPVVALEPEAERPGVEGSRRPSAASGA